MNNKNCLLLFIFVVGVGAHAAAFNPGGISGCLAYQGYLKSLGAVNYWPANDPAGTVAKDAIGTNTGTYVGSPTLKQSGYMMNNSMSVAYAGSASGQLVTTTTSYNNPTTFSILAWFKTTVTGGIMQFANSQTGQPSSYDRHLYIGSDNLLYFGLYPSSVKVVNSATTVTDGNWHMAIATLGAAGQFLYLDTATPVSAPTVTSAQSYTGYWRIGYALVSGWTNPGQNFFTGNLAGAAYFTNQLTTAQAAMIYKLATTCRLP